MRKVFKYRIFPSKAQTAILRTTLNLCCLLYNAALQERISAWKKQRVSVNYYTQGAQLPDIKTIFPELSNVFSQTLQDVLRRLDKAFKAFFRRMKTGDKPGFPRFKSSKRYNSFTYPQGGFKVVGQRLVLSKIGDIHIKLHRPIRGRIKTCSILRDGAKWFACFSVEQDEVHTAPRNTDVVGIDMGLEYFLTLSSGEQVSNPRIYRKAEKRLARAQRRKKYVRSAYRKVRNQRLDFHHKLSRCLVDRFNTIVVEDLNIHKMTQSPKQGIPKSVNDAGWGQFVQFLVYKAEEAGGRVVRVAPEFTSQICPGCGVVRKKELRQRWHLCEDCGCSLHRDHAAALNILALGRQCLGKSP